MLDKVVPVLLICHGHQKNEINAHFITISLSLSLMTHLHSAPSSFIQQSAFSRLRVLHTAMECTASDYAWVLNANLYDAATDEAELLKQLSLGLFLPLCTISTAALLSLASIALALHSILLCQVLVALTRIAVRFRATWSTR